jgi:hypothetical protein
MVEMYNDEGSFTITNTSVPNVARIAFPLED